MVARREPEEHGREQQPAIGGARVDLVPALLPANEGQEEQRHEREVEGVRIGVGSR